MAAAPPAASAAGALDSVSGKLGLGGPRGVPGVESGRGKSAALILPALGFGARPRVACIGAAFGGEELSFSAWFPKGLAGSFWALLEPGFSQALGPSCCPLAAPAAPVTAPPAI